MHRVKTENNDLFATYFLLDFPHMQYPQQVKVRKKFKLNKIDLQANQMFLFVLVRYTYSLKIPRYLRYLSFTIYLPR